ncbi:hypothetical protein LZ32DRAFT_378367 [Colletotrichum eremochloae]|nr:hypothetical protein LZ32DRAFT_378367 [Colletotrichum eremochloae]
MTDERTKAQEHDATTITVAYAPHQAALLTDPVESTSLFFCFFAAYEPLTIVCHVIAWPILPERAIQPRTKRAPSCLPLPVPRSSVPVADHAGLVGAHFIPNCPELQPSELWLQPSVWLVLLPNPPRNSPEVSLSTSSVQPSIQTRFFVSEPYRSPFFRSLTRLHRAILEGQRRSVSPRRMFDKSLFASPSVRARTAVPDPLDIRVV